MHHKQHNLHLPSNNMIAIFKARTQLLCITVCITDPLSELYYLNNETNAVAVEKRLFCSLNLHKGDVITCFIGEGRDLYDTIFNGERSKKKYAHN